ncbi:MAG: transglutaminase-like domain-containing protein [Hyphomicrobiaceae bacterium]|nr:transglutaminase-like domain-containing protein [Hyphomicrobiaceae bacterium]
MHAQTGPEIYRHHSTYTDPGEYAQQIADLPANLAALCQIVQGLIVHVAWAGRYGLPEKTPLNRATLPVSKRLQLILETSPAALSEARAPSARSPGTCRDFALMLCSILRQQGVPARTRCGFAAYLSPGRFEDHWICEYWKPKEQRWAIADAQIDQLHGDHLNITFEITDVPSGEFLNAGQAWSAFRKSDAVVDSFGHGTCVGQWFLYVNLVRDLFTLHNQEVSDWDTWRSATPKSKILNHDTLSMCDRIARATEHIRGFPNGFDETLDSLQTPPWQK